MMKKLLFSLLLFPLFAFTQVTVDQLCSRMHGISPEIQAHLKEALTEIATTENGKFLFSHVSPQLRFQARPMVQAGQADAHNVITLQSLRLNDTSVKADTSNLKTAKVCYTAEILAHEMMHNAQFHAGFFSYPASFSGYEAAFCERLLEMQAKFTGEMMFYSLRNKEKYASQIQPKPGLFLVSRRQSATPEKMYFENLWQNKRHSSEGKQLFREQTLEISRWNLYYAEQAFRNNYRRFLKDEHSSNNSSFADHISRIIQFSNMQITADFLVKNSPVHSIQNGILCQENGIKVLELEANHAGFEKRSFKGSAVRKVQIPLRNK